MGVGAYSAEDAIAYGLTGVMLRCTGVKRDIRLDVHETYANYFFTNFRSFYATNGDSFDRYLLRISEMFESLHIITQTLANLQLKKKTKLNTRSLAQYHSFGEYSFVSNFTSMEQTIRHFKY
jgi:NADH-quinone oxidoreductase subunit D